MEISSIPRLTMTIRISLQLYCYWYNIFSSCTGYFGNGYPLNKLQAHIVRAVTKLTMYIFSLPAPWVRSSVHLIGFLHIISNTTTGAVQIQQSLARYCIYIPNSHTTFCPTLSEMSFIASSRQRVGATRHACNPIHNNTIYTRRYIHLETIIRIENLRCVRT